MVIKCFSEAIFITDGTVQVDFSQLLYIISK